MIYLHGEKYIFKIIKRYADLANQLSINQQKCKLENYYFFHLYPIEYRKITKLLQKYHINRELYIIKFIKKLHKFMIKNKVQAEIYGRPKRIYSIWRKMQQKNLSFDEIFDILAVRIITDTLQDCYAVLSILHSYFYYLPEAFDDYVKNPKLNSYQSIHTVIVGPGGKIVEIQIRTKKMHKNAELGIAAHWKYKENNFGELLHFSCKDNFTSN